MTHHHVPAADRPPHHQSFGDIRILGDELLDHSAVVGPEHEQRTIDRILVGAGEDEETAPVRTAGERQMGVAQRSTALDIVADDVVEQQPVRALSS